MILRTTDLIVNSGINWPLAVSLQISLIPHAVHTSSQELLLGTTIKLVILHSLIFWTSKSLHELNHIYLQLDLIDHYKCVLKFAAIFFRKLKHLLRFNDAMLSLEFHSKPKNLDNVQVTSASWARNWKLVPCKWNTAVFL